MEPDAGARLDSDGLLDEPHDRKAGQRLATPGLAYDAESFAGVQSQADSVDRAKRLLAAMDVCAKLFYSEDRR